MPTIHRPVLLHEVVSNLVTKSLKESRRDLWYVDGTLGGAGHALAIAEALLGRVNILAFDRDPEAVKRGREALEGKAAKVIIENEDFRNMDAALKKHGIEHVDMILLDLGLSSDELENSGRGFSFQRDEPLLMTMGDPSAYPFTAKDILNEWKEEDIANVIFAYGEETYARRIAKAIVEYRTKKPIETTDELTEIVRSGVPAPYRWKKIHPATKTFQALRIAVNDELKAVEEGLKKGFEALGEKGRMGVISFHSLEDRIVKNFMRAREKQGSKLIPRKAVKPSDEEVAQNPRSRSAKLRVIEKHSKADK